MLKKDSMPWSIEVRRLRGELSQMEFATKIGVSLSTIGYWEQGKSSPHKRTKQRIRAICAGSAELVMPPDQQISPTDTGSVDPVLWAEFRRVATSRGRDPQDLLNEVVRFTIRRTAQHGSQPIEQTKKKGKVS